MFIAMNRYRVRAEYSSGFEKVWRERDSHLEAVPGFVGFYLLKGAEGDDHVLYASHSTWHSRGDFEAWTKSDAFRKAHKNAGQNKGLYFSLHILKYTLPVLSQQLYIRLSNFLIRNIL